jgi:hypothetical protein
VVKKFSISLCTTSSGPRARLIKYVYYYYSSLSHPDSTPPARSSYDAASRRAPALLAPAAEAPRGFTRPSSSPSPALGGSSARQRGQVLRMPSHGAMQPWWYQCAHGSRATASAALISSVHTAHTVPATPAGARTAGGARRMAREGSTEGGGGSTTGKDSSSTWSTTSGFRPRIDDRRYLAVIQSPSSSMPTPRNEGILPLTEKIAFFFSRERSQEERAAGEREGGGEGARQPFK